MRDESGADGRSHSETWGDKRIGDSLNIPLNRLVQRLGDLPRDRLVLLHCATGYRSAIGASLLLCDGLREVADFVGGITA